MQSRYFTITSRETKQNALEWALILGWAAWLGNPYLDLNPEVWPYMGEFAMSIQNHYAWKMLLDCGGCFFWNGFSNGGAPSFIDLHSAWLHPLSVLATFAFGAFNGGKILIVAGLFLSGLALWWTGKILQLGTLPRLWMAFLAVSGGHIVGRMEAASVPLVLSTAACSLVIPPAFELARSGDRKYAVILGLMLGLAVLSGQGYLQIGMVASLLVAIGYLLVKYQPDGLVIEPHWKEFVLAIGIALLIAAPLLIPMLHASPFIEKPTDPNFDTAQPLRYALLNLVIDDDAFFFSKVMGRPTLPYLYINYLGWIPIILAIYGALTIPAGNRKLSSSILLAIAIIYIITDVRFLKILAASPFGGLVSGLRNPPLIQGFVVPFIIILAGFGLQTLIHRQWAEWRISLLPSVEKNFSARLQLKWPVVLLVILVSLGFTAGFARKWIRVYIPPIEVQPVIAQLKTDDAQWVQTPFGDYVWIPQSIENNLKVRFIFRPWHIPGPDLPLPYLEAVNMSDGQTRPSYQINAMPDSQYAYVLAGESKIPCRGSAQGGYIDVTCDNPIEGKLVVLERFMPGWRAWRDGVNINLRAMDWLTVTAPAGKHTYQFRYIPWDAPLGIVLSISGWLLSFVLYWRASRARVL